MRDPNDPYADEIAAATPTPVVTPSAAELRQIEIDACDLCDDQGYNGRQVCDHDPTHAETANRHMAHIRAQMGWDTPAGTTTPNQTQNFGSGQAGPQE